MTPRVPAINLTALGIPTSLTIFFIDFYSGQCYERFYRLYEACVGISGATMCWTAMLKIHLPQEDPDVQWNCVRYILAAQHGLYYTLRDFGMSDEEWKVILERQMLTPEEKNLVETYQGFAPLLQITWALQEVKCQLQAYETVPLPLSHTWKEFCELGFKLRQDMSLVVNLLKQPVPYPYFHLLNLMVLLTLSLVAYGLVGNAHPVITMAVHAIVCVIFIGMKNQAIAMADPFGHDAIDFKVEGFLQAGYRNVVAHLIEDRPPQGSNLPDGLVNPLAAATTARPSSTAKAEPPTYDTLDKEANETTKLLTTGYGKQLSSC